MMKALLLVPTFFLLLTGFVWGLYSLCEYLKKECTDKGGHQYSTGASTICISNDGRIIE